METILKSSEEKILITHGTDTIIETGVWLEKQLGLLDVQKIIILTGSFLPEKFKNSDADFNVGFAIGALQTYYIGQGHTFTPIFIVERGSSKFLTPSPL